MAHTSTEFSCKCGINKGWIEHGQISLPCPNCGRVYCGIERVKRGMVEIRAIEIKVLRGIKAHNTQSTAQG